MNRIPRAARVLLALLPALGLAGCPAYVLVAGKQSLSEYGFEVALPEGWYRAMHGVAEPAPTGPATAPEGIMLTRDGLRLQQIRIERVTVDKELRFTKRKLDEKLPPHEVAEVEIDEHRSNPAVFNFTLDENVPVTLAGRRGFKLAYSWTTKDGLRLRRLHYGFLEGKWAYRLVYQAAARHYFERDLTVFERVRESFRLLSKAAQVAPRPAERPCSSVPHGRACS